MRKRSALLCLLLAVACGPQAGDVGSNTNWLEACDADRDCNGSLACRCGICTLDCSAPAACERLPGAVCVPPDGPAAWTACQSSAPPLRAGICLPDCEPGSCGNGEACVSGACVPVPLPNSEFCSLLDGSEADQASEDALLALLQTARTEGNVVCEGDPPSVPVPPVRLDARLRCAARVASNDIDQTDGNDLIDSLGRGSEERMSLAGYDAMPWGETFVREAGSEQAFATMLSMSDPCRRFVDASFVDVGIGVSGDVKVMTLAAE